MYLLSSINRILFVSLFIFIFQLSYCQTIEDIISDICSQLSENQDINCDEISSYLYDIYNHKINITHKLTWICEVRVERIECWERVIT